MPLQYIGRFAPAADHAADAALFATPLRAIRAKIPLMSDRPSQIWRDMPLEKRVQAAAAFWRDTESPEIAAQHAEAVGSIARRMNFRTRSVLALPVERRAKHLAQLPDVSDAIATRALIAYHFDAQRPLMAAFLDALGIAHDNGLISDEAVPPPAATAIATAVQTVRTGFPSDDVDRYLKTLAVLDGDTWANLEGFFAGQP